MAVGTAAAVAAPASASAPFDSRTEKAHNLGTRGHRGGAVTKYLRPAIVALLAFAFAGVAFVEFSANGIKASSPATERVSIGTGGIQANNTSEVPATSADGRFVAFRSGASNLVPGKTNDQGDIFVHDRATGVTERVSVGSAGQEGNDASYGQPQISGDGRFVAFASWASNLVAGDLNGGPDVFVRDRQLAQTIRVSVDSSGGEQVFSSSVATNDMSNDGRYALFGSSAGNLVAGDTNGQDDVFRHDMQTGVTSRVSLGNSGVEGNAGSAVGNISDDGRFVAFASDASNIVPGDTNDAADVFVHDTLTATTMRVSVDSDGLQSDGPSAWPTISSDGRYVAFVSIATQLVPDDLNSDWDVFVHDRLTGQTLRVSVDSSGNESEASGWGSAPAAISANGRYVAFSSGASNLVPSDTNAVSDIFVHDIMTGATERVSLTSTQSQVNNESLHPSISGDGSAVAFHSDATNLVPSDTNGFREVFVRDRGLEVTPTPVPVGGIVHLYADPNTQRDQPASGSSLPLPASVAIGLLVVGAGGLYAVRMRRG